MHTHIIITHPVSQPHSLPGGEVPHCGDRWKDRQWEDYPGLGDAVTAVHVHSSWDMDKLNVCVMSPFQPDPPVPERGWMDWKRLHSGSHTAQEGGRHYCAWYLMLYIILSRRVPATTGT